MDAERTSDGRYLVIGGRKWRATDPSIPPKFEVELVAELMDARRAVGAAGRSDDAEAVSRARVRVQAAKVALGERGRAWWDEPDDDADRERLEAAIVTLLGHRGPEKTICPSDAARAVGGDRWRTLVPLAREVARTMARGGAVEVTQKGVAQDVEAEWKGPIRIRTAP